jgi:hypothetical protein
LHTVSKRLLPGAVTPGFFNLEIPMFFKNSKLVREVQQTLAIIGGGIHKRIDENRELLELLRRETPALIAARPWIEGWLLSQDNFLVELAKQVPVNPPRFRSESSPQNSPKFPRPLPDVQSSNSNTDWIKHAYPLQHISIELQGTRQSDRQSLISQLESVLARLRAGELTGEEDDDDFGYRFSVNAKSLGPSIFKKSLPSN